MWPFRRKDAAPAVERKTASFFIGTGRASFISRNYRALADEGYAQNAVAYACVSKIASAVATPDIFVYEKDSRGNVRKLDNHPLVSLIDNPNPAQSGRAFRSALASYHRIGGNAFVLGNGVSQKRPPKELQLLDPLGVVVRPGRSIFPESFDYTSMGRSMSYPVNQITGASDVLHIKTFNPLDPWYGLAPMTAAAYAVDIFNAGMKWNKKLLDNDCRPPGALVMKDSEGKPATLTDEQFFRLKEEMEQQYSGANNAGKPLLLEGGLEWQQLGMNPRDMDFRENLLTAARFTASALGVPPQLVNIPGESTYANFEQAQVTFWADTALPLLGSILDDFNRWLAPLYGEGIFLWYDEEMIPALEPLRAAKANRMNAAGYLTIDEKRAAMGNGAYTPGESPGSTIFVQSSLVPIELAGAIDLAEPGSEADPQ
jgi:HK97 family phage portal protein